MWIAFLRPSLNVEDSHSWYFIEGDPENVYTKDAPVVKPPPSVPQTMGRLRALGSSGVRQRPFEPTEWRCQTRKRSGIKSFLLEVNRNLAKKFIFNFTQGIPLFT